MLDKIKSYIFQKVFVNYLMSSLFEKFDKLASNPIFGPNGFKTMLSYLVILLGVVSALVPSAEGMIGTLLEMIRPHAGEVVVTGFWYNIFGWVHKIVKAINAELEKYKAPETPEVLELPQWK